MEIDPFIFRLSIFILSIFCWLLCCLERYPITSHTLMSVTNAISSVIIVGAIIAALAGTDNEIFNTSSTFGLLAITLAAINIFGGFLVAENVSDVQKKKK